MHILIANDDGIFAPGMRALVRAARARGHRVSVFAPDGPRSAMSHAISLNRPLKLKEVEYEEGVRAYSVSGTPADCVRLGLYLLKNDRPACVLSGVNNGENIGAAIVYSGTIGAAREGSLCGVSSLAVSLSNHLNRGFEHAAVMGVLMAEWAQSHPLPRGEIYSLNVPYGVVPKGVRSASVSHRFMTSPLYEETSEGYMLKDSADDVKENSACSDVMLMQEGYAALSIIGWNFLASTPLTGLEELEAACACAGPLEIERRYLIHMPDVQMLEAMPGCEIWELEQIYLRDGEDGSTRRVRSVLVKGEAKYFFTEKKFISNIACDEQEREIGQAEYESLLAEADIELCAIHKRRYRIPCEGQLLEIDLFSFWEDRATLEIEVDCEAQSICIPTWLKVAREITGERAYKNRFLAECVPMEEI